jgi:hypothetical protein
VDPRLRGRGAVVWTNDGRVPRPDCCQPATGTLGATAAVRRLAFPFLFRDRGGLLVCGPQRSTAITEEEVLEVAPAGYTLLIAATGWLIRRRAASSADHLTERSWVVR